MKLFIFDFDNTIVNGHTHNEIIKGINKREIAHNDANAQWDVVKNIPVIGSHQIWKGIFKTLIEQPHYSLCIASFNAYGHVIPKFLEKIGLSEKAIKQIKIIARLPKGNEEKNKNKHIKEAIALTKFSGKTSDIILIDDSDVNIDAARKQGYTGIKAVQQGSHLSEVNKRLHADSLELEANNNKSDSLNKYAVIFDFDDTIAAGKTYNTIVSEAKKRYPLPLTANEQWNLIKDIAVVGGNPEHWKSCIKRLLEKECTVSIAAFTAYPGIIRKYLMDKVGLSEEECDKIAIKTQRPPKKNESQDKTPLIQQLLDDLKTEGRFFEPGNVLIVDDRETHINRAHDKGYAALLADKYAAHLNTIRTLFNLSPLVDRSLKPKPTSNFRARFFPVQGSHCSRREEAIQEDKSQIIKPISG